MTTKRCRICGVREYRPPRHTTCLKKGGNWRLCAACREEVYTPEPDEDSDFDLSFRDPGGVSALRAENVITQYDSYGRERRYCRVHGCHARVRATFVYCPKCASVLNQRNLPCPTCGRANQLTPEDARHHYQCDACADAIERYG